MANNTISQIEINDQVYDILDANTSLRIYPVGSIYMSVNSTSPSTLFGGTWESIQDRFLLAAGSTYSAGQTGGEATHVLTASETALRNHTHSMSDHTHTTWIGSHSHSVTTDAKKASNIIKVGNTVLKWNAAGANASTGEVRSSGTAAIDVHIPSLSGSAASTDLGSKTSGGPSNNTTGGVTAANGSAHNNMPPYLAVYVWKRTA